jgi:hypothetical protein
LGKPPAELRDIFCAARLIALPNKPNGVRTIAVGETFRRIAAKCLVQKYQAQAMEGLTPLQVVVGLPGSVEAVVFKVREWMRSAPAGHALLTLDLSNSCNTIDRSAMLAGIALKFPYFPHYAKFCFGAPAPLLAEDFSIFSSTGTQQGDGCGPLFFSGTVLDAIIAANVPWTTWSHWYLDDGLQAVPLASLAAAIAVLEPCAAAVGMKLNRRKCKLCGPGDSEVETAHQYPSLAGIPWVPWTAGLVVLGTPVLQPQGHLEKYKTGSDETIPEDFIRSYNRRVFHTRQMLVASTGACRRCKAGPIAPKREREDGNKGPIPDA